MNENRFTGKADNYDKYRPSYPALLVDWLYSDSIKSVADIGAGTGKFTVMLADKPWNVTAVEPNSDMLEKLRINAPFATLVQASAEDTGLAPCSVDLITAATAFHWFDEVRFRAECQRILTPEGRLAVIFNNRVQDALWEDCSRLFGELCGFKGHAGRRSIEDGGRFLLEEYFAEVQLFNADNSLTLDRTAFIGRNLSRSYALTEQHPKYAEFIRELHRIFDKHEQNGIITEIYKTTCYKGKF